MHRFACSLIVLSLAALSASGCLDNGTQLPPPKLDHWAPAPDGPSNKLPPPQLDLGRIPSRVCGEEVGIIGTATPGVTIIVTGGASASGVIGDAHPVSGQFCLAVKLRLEQANTLNVIAQDPTRGLSVPAIITVIQEDCGNNNGEFKDAGVGDAGAAKNIAFGLVGKSKETPQKGNHGFLTDGKLDTWVAWSGSANWYCGWCDYGGWVMLTLPEVAQVERIVVRWRDSEGNGVDYGSEYKVLYTSVTEPPDPNLDDGYWTVAKAFSDGKGGTDEISMKSQGNPLMRHVALWFQQDARPFWKESGTFGTVDETFAVSEIEIWEAPKGPGPPPPPANVCQGY